MPGARPYLYASLDSDKPSNSSILFKPIGEIEKDREYGFTRVRWRVGTISPVAPFSFLAEIDPDSSSSDEGIQAEPGFGVNI